MFKMIGAVVLGLLLIGNICYAQDTPPLSMKLEVSKGPYLPQQTFNIKVVLKNESNKTLKILRPFEASLRFSIYQGKEQEKPEVVSLTNISPYNVISLEPSEVVTGSMPSTTFFGDYPKAAGKYLLQISYVTTDIGYPGIEKIRLTQTIPLEYINPQNEDLCAWELYENRLDKNSGLPKIDILEKIVRVFPKTCYGKQSAEVLITQKYTKDDDINKLLATAKIIPIQEMSNSLLYIVGRAYYKANKFSKAMELLSLVSGEQKDAAQLIIDKIKDKDKDNGKDDQPNKK